MEQHALRKRLPNRRLTDTQEIEFKGKSILISIGYNDDKPAEVFIYLMRASSDFADAARDIAVLLSIALQHGVPLAEMRDAVCRLDSGEAAGLAGAVLDHLCGAPTHKPAQWPPESNVL